MPERGATIEFEGPGPFELPKCGTQVSVLTVDDQYFLLELVTEGRSQTLFVPISNRALPALKVVIDGLYLGLGRGQTKQ